MNIEIVEEIGRSFIKMLSSDSMTWETDFENRIKIFNPAQTKAILTWVKGEITWDKSKLWQASDRNKQILQMIDKALHEAEFCKKNLKTRPRGYKKIEEKNGNRNKIY